LCDAIKTFHFPLTKKKKYGKKSTGETKYGGKKSTGGKKVREKKARGKKYRKKDVTSGHVTDVTSGHAQWPDPPQMLLELSPYTTRLACSTEITK